MRPIYFLLALLSICSPLHAADRLSPSLTERERVARETRQALAYVTDYHYSQKSLKDFSAREILTEYAENLDYTRMFFTQAQMDEFIKRFEPTLQAVYLSRGDIFPALDLYNYYYKNVQYFYFLK